MAYWSEKRDALFQEYLRLQKISRAAQDVCKKADDALRQCEREENEARKTPEEKAAEAQTGECGCICGCKTSVQGTLYMGRVCFWRCNECTSFNCG